MTNRFKIASVVAVTVLVLLCAFLLCSCKRNTAGAQSNQFVNDSLAENISFGKKYYYLNSDNYATKEYYLFNKDGSATYHHTIEDNGKVTFQTVLNFKWEYTGNGNYLLYHNGTQILKGQQDDATGFCRTMRVTKNAMYWDAFEPSAYFVCEDFVEQIPNYAKFVK